MSPRSAARRSLRLRERSLAALGMTAGPSLRRLWFAGLEGHAALSLAVRDQHAGVALPAVAGGRTSRSPSRTIDDAILDDLARRGFDWIWLLSVWQTGAASRAVSRSNPAWQAEFRLALPDLTEEDICGSGFAISAYEVDEALGGRRRWPRSAPGWPRAVCGSCSISCPITPRSIIPGSRRIPISTSRAASRPWRRRRRTTAGSRPTGAAHPGLWARSQFPRLAGHAAARLCQSGAAGGADGGTAAIAGQCDGVRCDMAMLVLPEVFQRTWGRAPAPFWPKAIAAVREAHPASPSWPRPIGTSNGNCSSRASTTATTSASTTAFAMPMPAPFAPILGAGLDYQDRLARFLENHDEPRAAAVFPWPRHRAAAIVTYFAPGCGSSTRAS